jgi:hypothetical protein
MEELTEKQKYMRKWRAANKEKCRASSKEGNKKSRQRIREWYFNYKATHHCEVCGEAHPACIQFHHLDPSQKDNLVCVMVKNRVSIERIEEEIKKCQVLCANCHSKVHWYGKDENERLD